MCSRVSSNHCERCSSRCFLIGWDGRKPDLQSPGSQPGERADDGGLREAGQRCKHGAPCIFIFIISPKLIYAVFTFLAVVFLSASSCWSGSAGRSPGWRTGPRRRPSTTCRPSRRTSETTAQFTNHPRFRKLLQTWNKNSCFMSKSRDLEKHLKRFCNLKLIIFVLTCDFFCQIYLLKKIKTKKHDSRM